MVQTKVKIVSNLQVAPDYFKMVLDAPEVARRANPGQFIHVRVNEELDPLLRRPFSIHRVTSKQIEILYKIRGKATQILSGRKSKELLDIIGPLGNGFPLPETNRQKPVPNEATQKSQSSGSRSDTKEVTTFGSTSILVAGGFGVAPLVFLAEELVRSPCLAGRQAQSLPCRQADTVHILIGAKSKNVVLCRDDFQKLGCQVEVATEDGSLGYKGLVTDLLKSRLSTINYRLSTIYAAGPNFMLQEIKEIAKILKILSFGSLEENIACGLGGCFGCAVKTTEGYRRVCRDGPVFNLKEIVWE